MSVVTIKCARREDYTKFHKLHKRFSYLESTSIRDIIVDEPIFMEYVERESMFLAFNEAGLLIGYAIVDAYEDATCDIQEIFVAPEHQKKGYGKMLVQHIKEVAKQDGIKKLSVFSIFVETDRFWMLQCGFRPEEGGALVFVIN